ncbi:triose-phosphate isomerase [Candidatus Dependentiae bacterium]|nr:MAG: triose-phosphate isomerase [Candidatus Dependentiae bacterium]
MKLNTFIFVANWKMQLSFNETEELAREYFEHLTLIKKIPNLRIILCPSFPALFPLSRLFKNSEIKLGAQDCSQFRAGAYTGQVCAKSIAELGCHYCIIGHSERRHYNHETNTEIADKVQRLLEQELQPIICVGETKQEYKEQKAFTALEQQLEPVLTRIADIGISHEPIHIAYEPIWSIGTGIVPSNTYLNEIFTWIEDHTQKILGKERVVGLLYGGSVSEQTIAALKKVKKISGLLIGEASLDFQKFNNIVNLI